MALIIKEDLYPKCVSTGREIEGAVVEGIRLTDEDLEDLFQPLLEIFEEKASVAARREVDEYQGHIDQVKKESAQAKIRAERRSHISELANYSVDGGETCRRLSRNVVEKTALCWNTTYSLAEWDINDAPDQELLEYLTDDEHWDDYIPFYTLDLPEEQQVLVGGGQSDVIKYLKSHVKDVYQARDLLKSIHEKRILKYNYFMRDMIDMCNFIIDLEPPRKRQKL